MSKSVLRFPQIPFYRAFFENKGPDTSLHAKLFVQYLDQNFSLVILHESTIFHCQSVFTSKVFEKNVFLVSCAGA